MCSLPFSTKKKHTIEFHVLNNRALFILISLLFQQILGGKVVNEISPCLPLGGMGVGGCARFFHQYRFKQNLSLFGPGFSYRLKVQGVFRDSPLKSQEPLKVDE